MIEETQKFPPAELQKKKEGFLFLIINNEQFQLLFYIYKLKTINV